MPTTWTIAIDWDRNNNFIGTYDDVTDRVLSAEWFLGIQRLYEDMADNAVLNLVLNNFDKRFSPEYTSSPIAGKTVPFRPIRIQSNDGITTRTHWVGWVETVQPMTGRYGQRQLRILANGPMQFYKAAEAKVDLQENKRTDEIIAQLLKEVVMPPALSQAWVLGRLGNSDLGTTTILADTTAYSDLEQGKLTLAMAADNWVKDGGYSNASKSSFDVYQAIEDITAAEHGKFFFNREGKAVFWNRHHLLLGGSPVATFNDAMTGMEYTYANVEETKNEIIVICHPRTISSVATDVLWELGDSVIRVEAGKTRELYVNYKDEKDKRIGARDVTVTDIEFERGSASATVTAKATGAELKFVNNGTTETIITKCVVKGRKIVDSGEMEAKAISQGDIIDYGRRSLRINLPSIDNLEDAQYIADFERDRRSAPRGSVNTVTFISHGKNGGGQHTHQLARTIGDMIRIEETQTAHGKNYYIIGETHKLAHSGTRLETTWYLEPAPDEFPWKLGSVGRSELGTATRITY